MSQAGTIDNGAGGTGVETLTGNTGGAISPSANNINVVGSGGVNVAGNAGTHTLTISFSGTVFTWSVIVADQTVANGNGYFCNGASTLELTLPAVSNVGDTFKVAAMNANGWKIIQGAGQYIQYGNQTTTVGAGGTLATTQIGDTAEFVCHVANTGWFVTPGTVGNLAGV